MNKNLRKVKELIYEFDIPEVSLSHDELNVEIPQLLFREAYYEDFEGVLNAKLKIELICSSGRVLNFVCKVCTKSHLPKDIKIEKKFHSKKRRIAKFEFSQEISLSPKDSVKLLSFLIGYFEGVELNFNTTLSR